MNWIKDEGIEYITDWISFVEHEKVPEYVAAIAAMNVSIIPFDVKNPTAYYVVPNNLWGYLSQGANVVSTPILEEMAYRRLPSIAGSKDEYVAALKKAKREKNAGKRIQNDAMTYLRRRTWSVGAKKIRKRI